MILMIQTRLMDGVIGCDNGKINNPTWLLTVSIRKTSRFLFWQKIYSIDVKRAFGSGSKLSTILVFTFQTETQTGKISPQLIFFKSNYYCWRFLNYLTVASFFWKFFCQFIWPIKILMVSYHIYHSQIYKRFWWQMLKTNVGDDLCLKC